MKKRIFAAGLCLAILIGLFAACGAPSIDLPFIGSHEPDDTIAPVSPEAEENVLRAAVLYNAASGSGAWEDLWSRLSQPLLMGFTAELVDVSSIGWSLEGYDLCYPDESVITARNSLMVRDAITDFAQDGGGVFLTSGFYDFFSRDFLGARHTEELTALPDELTLPEVESDLTELQTVAADFFDIYKTYEDYEALSQLSYGHCIVPSTAVPLAMAGESATAAVNRYGDGWVFYGCALLPNAFAICGTELKSRDETQTALSETTMSFDRLMENAFAAFIAKKTWGFAVWRVFGSFGTPSLAWEMSIEDSDTVARDGAADFYRLCAEYNEMPSYSLARSIYTYGLRAESVTYLLGTSDTSLAYQMDTDEGVYSSGTHIVAGGQWLRLKTAQDGESYFSQAAYDMAACPVVYDYNGDGRPDVLSGSADGQFYRFKGEGFSGGKLRVSAAAVLRSGDGAALSVPSHSAPCLFDVDGDGVEDIISGAADGDIYWFAGGEGDAYEPMGKLLSTGIDGHTMPDAGDIDGDGLADLVVGSDAGRLLIYYGTASGTGFSHKPREVEVFGVDGDWLSPRIFDLDGDGIMDIAVGTGLGYVSRLLGDGEGGFAGGGYIETDEMNAEGSYGAKFGVNCTPFFYDINADGRTDLICGATEYGLAYPISSAAFPQYSLLYRQINFLVKSGCYVGVHFFTGEYASPQRESGELTRHLAALRGVYKAGYGPLGASRHTDYGSTLDFSQTFLSAWDQGLMWYSGAPGEGRNGFSLPWYLTVSGERTILLQNRVTPELNGSVRMELAARYNAPLLLAFEGDAESDAAQEVMAAVSAFRVKTDYSCVREDQLMLSVAAEYNSRLSIVGTGDEGLDLTLSATAEDDGIPLYDARYQGCCGARISLGSAYAAKPLAIEATVWHRDGSDVYVSLDSEARIYESEDVRSAAHLSAVNLPARIGVTESGQTVVSFMDGGMMQVTVTGPAASDTPGWSRSAARGHVTFTKYGGAASIVLDLGND